MATTRPSRTVKPMTENGATLGRHDDAGGAVDERGAHVRREPREHHRPAGHGLRAADDDRRVGIGHASVGAQDDVGVEHGHERVEVALRGPRRRRRRRPPAGARGPDRAPGASPCTRRRARLASWRAAVGVRPTIGAISSNGTANMSCSTNARRSAGGSVSSTTSSASPTESASRASCSGSTSSARLMTGSGTRTASSGSSRRVRRDRSTFRQTRATTVVSQPPRFSIASASDRLSRSQASWTASSASSATRASGTPRPVDGCGAPRTAGQGRRAGPWGLTLLRRHRSYH